MRILRIGTEKGFTLVEIIVVLILAAIFATMMFTYFGNSLTQSSMPIVRMDAAGRLHSVMENITADYDSLSTPRTHAALATLQGRINALNYGAYTVVENKFIKFDSSRNEVDDTAADAKILKVKIRSSLGEVLTALFVVD